MKSRFLFTIIGSTASTVFSTAAYATTCTPGDYAPIICDLKIYEGERCINAQFFAAYCNKDTDGCVVNGVNTCEGFTPPGHWYPIIDPATGINTWRCRCGCFGEETEFGGLIGLTGTEMIKKKSQEEELQVYGLTSFRENQFESKDINGIMFSPEKEKAFRISTQGGHTITLSQAHPVVIVDSNGKLTQMKQAKLVKQGEYLVDADGHPDPIAKVEKVDYKGLMMNFNVKSRNMANHIVIANGLQMGDLTWQERVNSAGSRTLYRIDIMKSLQKNPTGNKR